MVFIAQFDVAATIVYLFLSWVVLGIKHPGEVFSIRKYSNTAKIHWERFQWRNVKTITQKHKKHEKHINLTPLESPLQL